METRTLCQYSAFCTLDTCRYKVDKVTGYMGVVSDPAGSGAAGDTYISYKQGFIEKNCLPREQNLGRHLGFKRVPTINKTLIRQRVDCYRGCWLGLIVDF